MTAIMPALPPIQAALDAVASYDTRHLLIIFSDMLELGEAGLDEHLRLAPAIEAAGAKSVWRLARLCRPAVQNCPQASRQAVLPMQTACLLLWRKIWPS